ncbi:hypothetical protein H2203_002146 [Taxawa tesnikishii (nom. ined.)]|nr:hypothetical protein H2203_002146 [Dothideales sp. JES 119]
MLGGGFSPQIIENFRRSSAEGLSIEFIIIWLAGDFANIIGAVAQKVLPTMVRLLDWWMTIMCVRLTDEKIILAIYYTLADIVLLGQCFYYRGFTFRDPNPAKKPATAPGDDEAGATLTERSALLPPTTANGGYSAQPPSAADSEPSRTRSRSSFRERFTSTGELLSPALPMHPAPKPEARPKSSKPRPLIQKALFNLTAIVVVVAAGVAGYYLSPSNSNSGGETEEQQEDILTFSITGQVFGYLCALLYLGSRLPQLLLNYRRKSTEGLNALFFLFACIGNLTYVLSIFAFDPICAHGRRGDECAPGEAGRIYGRYILVNLSWLLGSLGTLFLDAGVFVQFFMYRKVDDDEDEWVGREEGVPDDVPRDESGEGRGRAPNER